MVDGSERYDVEMTQSKCSGASLAYSGLLGCTVLALVGLEVYHALGKDQEVDVGPTWNLPQLNEIAEVLHLKAWTFRLPDQMTGDHFVIELTWVQSKRVQIDGEDNAWTSETEEIQVADTIGFTPVPEDLGSDVRLVIQKTEDPDGKVNYKPWLFLKNSWVPRPPFSKPDSIERRVNGTPSSTRWGDPLFVSETKEGITYSLQIDID